MQANVTSKPVVAIVGKQNVGKSTLLNRMAGKRLAIVQDLPGTTRDRVFASISEEDREFTLVDTGGLEPDPHSTIAHGVKQQVETAITDASVIIFLVDVRDGVTPPDQEIADMLRKVSKPVLLAVNKADNARLEEEAAEFYQLGLGDPLPISVQHGRGIAELMDKIASLLPAPGTTEPATEVMRLAIVGRPNVGKSMLLNALVGTPRAIVDEVPGTTHDALDTLVDFKGESMLLIDTAGIRRRGKVQSGVEKYSVIRSLRAIERADVALLVVDATEPVTAQDTHIAGYIQQAAKGIVLIVNKWDLIEDKNTSRWQQYLRSKLRFMSHAPAIFTSARFGQGIGRVIPQAREVYQERQKRVSTAVVNDLIQEAAATHPSPRRGNKQLKVYYATQAEVAPPTFVFSVNDAKLAHFSYQRYLENRLRQAFGFQGTPLRLIFKTRGG
ncbi:ribosome biogenesis GTPase Der [Chloroflexota bacterium]